MNIVLIGFMGAGKTSVGKILSSKLMMNFIDVDNEVIKISGRRSINEIFERDGEIKYRELEIYSSKLFANMDNTVISTGGGVVMNNISIDYYKKNGKVIYLKTDLATVMKRINSDYNRPLFKDKIVVHKLFQLRFPLYKIYADFIIKTDNLSKKEVTDKIINIINKRKLRINSNIDNFYAK